MGNRALTVTRAPRSLGGEQSAAKIGGAEINLES
jgi:hypothetical protein